MLRRKRLRVSDKGCVALCVDNMRRVQELSPIELVEMFVTVFCFLKDSSDVSQVILDDFRSYQGYNFLAEFLLKYVLTSAVLSAVSVSRLSPSLPLLKQLYTLASS